MGRFDTPTDKPFRDALADLLREHDFTTQTGNVNWHAFADTVDDVHYETLRKVLAGERTLTPNVIEQCAKALRIDPGYFVEYRAMEIARNFDVREVGFETVLDNLERWAADVAAKKKKK